MKYKFVADASVDVPKEFLEKYDIEIVPIEVNFGEERYLEGMPTREFYQKVNESKIIPKTAMPNAYKFEQIYKDVANKPNLFVMTLVISMEMSPTKLQAQMAAENLGMKNVFIEECACTTVAQGALICQLCRYIDAHPNVTPEELIKEFYRLRDKVRLFAVVDDLKYLKASGRLSSTGAIVGSMLKVKPIVGIVDGKVVNVAKVMGVVKAEQYLKDKLKTRDRSLPIYTAHSDYEEAMLRLVEKSNDVIDGDEVIYCEIGYVVGSHVGPKCYGFVYFE